MPASAKNAHDFSFSALEAGKEIKLSEFKDKVVLVVNTACLCGFTPQYEELQKLYDEYKEKGLVIIGVPSDDFGGQELDTEEDVKKYVDDKFKITFPLTRISKVKGSDAIPFYKWANKKAGFIGSPKWNFHKYLISKNGDFIDWFSTKTSPTSDKIKKAIEAELAK
ncbi:MAG TPA: glutathione peroxidase [Alphaproteobacteria bacterium]|nr:glutathione peroxidase [Alphaproteobacteria bacterium]